MLGVWDKILVGLQQVRAIALVSSCLICCQKTLPVLIVFLPQTKPRTLPKMESTASQSQHLDFFANKAAELIDFDAGVSLYRFGSWGVIEIARVHQSQVTIGARPNDLANWFGCSSGICWGITFL